ncbi:hypothetical protein [Butyrivibrio sp. M55]|uniref:hypothetical protein n=1 Tax=Butyrivibrio sp. M55 TaxID=1855323 RepID=UPI0008E28E0B|nr:hypothetical protein [Butyrivibrio sp. M55]SFU91917.1 hypothetical protein SAMN05216540_12126 [Butyrivibrio sp. M55]
MTIDKYINPDFTRAQQLVFLGFAFAGLLIISLIIMFGTRMSVCLVHSSERHDEFKRRTVDNMQLFFEMMISSTSVILFACAYIICNHIFELLTPLYQAKKMGSMPMGIKWFYYQWDKNKDFLLLFLISMTCFINTVLDKIIIPLRRISKEDKASVRMLGMFYAIIVLTCFTTFGDATVSKEQYSPIMMYYFGLMIGRFVYFDASFVDFIYAILGAIKHGLLLVFALLLSGILSVIGFKLGYLIKENYYIVGLLYTDIFILVAIFIMHHLRGLLLFIRNEEDEEYEEYDDYDDEDEEYEDEEDEEDDDEGKELMLKRKKKAKKAKKLKVKQQFNRRSTDKLKEYDSYGGYDNGDYDDFDV